MKYSVIEKFNIDNGPGTRVVLWTQGCAHHCPGCHNPHTWKLNSGKDFTENERNLIMDYLDEYFPKDFSILGGEPLHPQNRDGVIELCNYIKENRPETNIWLWSGYELDEIIDDKRIFESIDTLVLGRFKIDLKGKFKFFGSSNQELYHTSLQAFDKVGEGILLNKNNKVSLKSNE